MVIIGFDPGLTNTGYAILSKKNNEIELLECGLISPKNSKVLSERLYTIFFESNKLLEKFKPKHVSVESVFFGKNVQSAIKLGQAKSAVMLAAEHNKIKSTDFSPKEIKQSIVGNGSASKEQVAFMVKKIFKLNDDLLKKNDISDAIAVAWCGLNRI
tara:strand:+ start:621 stop:1091 length:471 start_codon:yes stop_codon:yes gene_type:complete